jgi:acyl dehydratase
MLDYQAVKNWDFGAITHAYTQRDTMLYALGVGVGADPMDAGQLRFVFEKDLQVMPTMAAVLGTPGFWWRDARTGADWVKLVHGEQRIRLFKPLPAAATLVAKNRVVSLTDKGVGKGAIAVIERSIYAEGNSELLALSTQVTFLRGDGGFSEAAGANDPGPDALPTVPERAPDMEIELASLPQAALIYRLSGDYNTLHADPEVARAAGFSRPILHGLCTFGMAAHAVLKGCCEYDAARIKAMSVRFTSPVYPGEAVRFQLWRNDNNTVQLRAQVAARDVTVLNNGVIELA